MARPSKRYIRQYMRGERVPLASLPDEVRDWLYGVLEADTGYNKYIMHPAVVYAVWTRETCTVDDIIRVHGYGRTHANKILDVVKVMDKMMCAYGDTYGMPSCDERWDDMMEEDVEYDILYVAGSPEMIARLACIKGYAEEIVPADLKDEMSQSAFRHKYAMPYDEVCRRQDALMAVAEVRLVDYTMRGNNHGMQE